MAFFRDKTDYAGIGRDAKPEVFLAELKREKRNYKKNNAKNEKVLDGAFQAFREGRVENIQAYIADARDTEKNYVDAKEIASTLLRLTEESSDKAAAINLVLEGMTEQERQKTLDAALRGAIHGDSNGDSIGGEAFHALLLDAGADPNVEIKGYICSVFVGAILHDYSSLVKFLHERGGNFDRVNAAFAESFNYAADKFEFYREALEGKPAVVKDNDLRQTVIEMRQQIQDLTAVASRIASKARTEVPSDEPAAPEQPTRTRRPYPTVNF